MFSFRLAKPALAGVIFALAFSLSAVALAADQPSEAPPETAGGRGESFAAPNFRELALTSLMLEAFDSTKNETIDEYAKLMYCPLYRENFKSDFAWNNVRQELGRKLQGKREYFRTHYEIAGVVYLGRYSFETQDFPFVKDTALVNVGSLTLLNTMQRGDRDVALLCDDTEGSKFFPTVYLFGLQQPLTLDRLKMPLADAEKLLARMDGMNNKERALYIRFRVRLLGAGVLVERRARKNLLLRGELAAVDLFYDREMSKHFASISLK